jgi:hypothetical protein
MAKWYLKGNARRFHRINMPLKTLILPKNAITDKEIYATGIDYFPPTIIQKINLEKRELQNAIGRVQEHKELLTTLFNEVIDYIEFLGGLVRDLAEGLSPKQSADYWLKVKQYQQGFSKVHTIKSSSPKTYEYFKHIETKYLAFLEAIIYSIENSTPKLFAVQGQLPQGFKIDELYDLFENPKFEKIPLVQALRHTIAYLNLYLGIYHNLNSDHYLKNFPKEWPMQECNVSAGGVALMMEKRFKLHERVQILAYFLEYDRTLNFEGNIVALRSIEESFKERIAINFEFPDGYQQDFLQTQIELYEIKESLECPIA